VVTKELPATTVDVLDAAPGPVEIHDERSTNTSHKILPTAPIGHSTPVKQFVPLFDDAVGSEPMTPEIPPVKARKTRVSRIAKGKACHDALSINDANWNLQAKEERCLSLSILGIMPTMIAQTLRMILMVKATVLSYKSPNPTKKVTPR
jgi:hypothetical protein